MVCILLFFLDYYFVMIFFILAIRLFPFCPANGRERLTIVGGGGGGGFYRRSENVAFFLDYTINDIYGRQLLYLVKT